MMSLTSEQAADAHRQLRFRREAASRHRPARGRRPRRGWDEDAPVAANPDPKIDFMDPAQLAGAIEDGRARATVDDRRARRRLALTRSVGDPELAPARSVGEMKTTSARAPATERSPLASSSVAEHVLRGAVGLLAAALAIVLVAIVGPVSLLLLGVTVIAWRGCPTCWAVGLLGTLTDRRAGRGCSRC